MIITTCCSHAWQHAAWLLSPNPCCCVQVVDLRLLASADVAVNEVAGASGRGAAYLQELQTRAGQLQAQAQRVTQLQGIFKLAPSQ